MNQCLNKVKRYLIGVPCRSTWLGEIQEVGVWSRAEFRYPKSPHRKCLGSTPGFAEGFLPEAFPIKASDHPEVETGRSPVATDWWTY